MKRLLSVLLSAVMIIGLMSCMEISALASSYATVGIRTELKLYDTGSWNEQIDSYTTEVSVPGMNYYLANDDTELWIGGTPTDNNVYKLKGTVTVTGPDGDRNDTFSETLYISKNSSLSKTIKCTVGKYTYTDIYSHVYGTLDVFDESWNGLTFESDMDCIYVYGTPVTAGTHTFTRTVNDGNLCNISISISVTVNGSGDGSEIVITDPDDPKPDSDPEPKEDEPAEDVPELKITKSPTGETVTAGEAALFISSAENYSDVEWRVVTKDGNNCWRNKAEIEGKFQGVEVNIYKNTKDQECLYLENIPESMNGYYIQTKFWSKDKSKTAFTSEKSCLLTVEQAELKSPIITSQPKGTELDMGRSATLTISASSPDGNKLKYQWYSNSNNSTAGGQMIQGATGSTCTPAQIEGTTYYYCAVYNTKDSETSSAVYSSVVPVKYNSLIQTTTTPVPQTTPLPSTTTAPAGSVTPSPAPVSPSPAQDSDTETKSDNSFLLFVGAIVIAALGCGTALLINMIKSRKEEEAYDEENDSYSDEEYYDDDQDYSNPRMK